MTDPRIRYDILANAEGEEDVARLAAELEKLDDAIDPQAAARAKALAEEMRALGERRASIEAFLRALADSDAAARGLEQTQEAARKLGQALEGVEKPTKAQQGQLQRLQDATERAQRALTEKTAALSAARAGLDRLGVGTTDLGGKQQALAEALGRTRTQARELAASYQAAASAAATSASVQARAQGQVKSGLDELNDTYRRLQGVAAVAIGGGIFTGLIRDVAATADEYRNLEARIKLVTGEGEAFTAAFAEVSAIAQRTNSSLNNTGNLFARIAEAGRSIGIGQQQSLQLTETITRAVAISGASAQASEAAITQLLQGLQSGVLRGEEFNSVNEQTTRVIQALADGLGVTRGELRKMAEQGLLTAEVVLPALSSQAEVLRKEFETLPPTVGRAIQTLSNSWTLYVGEVDKANGISQKAAQLIVGLAENLETLGTVLLTVGQAAAAYKALSLAQTFLGIGAAAKVAAAGKVADAAATAASTVATTANTAALAANTAARTSNAAATAAGAAASTAAAAATAAGAAAEAAASKGLLARVAGLARFAGGIGLVISAVLLLGDLLVKAFRAGGEWIGQAAAKLAGFKDRSEEVGKALTSQTAATEGAAASTSQLTGATKAAETAATGLTATARGLVGEFDQLRAKGESVDEALKKVGGSLQLSDPQGIRDSVAALDALAEKGKASGEQIRAALANALDGEDLDKFEVQARAVFDGTARGAERLALAVQASLGQAIKRTGLDLAEITNGVSRAAALAIGDFDRLLASVSQLRQQGLDVDRVLSASLNKALEAATTEKAVQAVIDRWAELGRQGTLTGDKLTQGLEQARKKLDDLQSGVNSLDEALRVFGLKSQAELDKVATTFRDAYAEIERDATLSFEQKQRAFRQYAEAAIAANRGIATSELQLKAEAVKLRIEIDETGRTVVRTFAEAEQAIERAASKFPAIGTGARRASDEVKNLSFTFGQLGAAADAAGSKARKAVQDAATPSLGGASPGAIDIRDPAFLAARNAAIGPTGSLGDLFRATPRGGITRTGSGQIPPPPGNPADYFFNTSRRGEGPFGLGVWELTPEAAAREAEFIRNPDGRAPAPAPSTSSGISGPAGGRVVPAPPPQPTSTATPASAGGQAVRTVRLELVVAGRSFPVQAPEAMANDLLGAIERAKLTGG